MKLQDQLDSTDLNMTEMQVKAFFLGAQCAEKPMPFSHAVEELLSDIPESKPALEAPLKTLWDSLAQNKKKELTAIFPNDLEGMRDQIDFFLTGMSLAGTNSDKCKNEELLELVEFLEEALEELDDLLSDSPSSEEEEEFKEYLLDNWTEFTATYK